MHWINASDLVAFLTLASLEIVLGIDNLVFLAILSGKLPEHKRKHARTIGLTLALGARIVLLLGISWVMKLTDDLFNLFSQGVSGKDLILIVGGLFLIAKATHEIHGKMEGDEKKNKTASASGFTSVIIQIVLIDMVFSLDSVITALGMAQKISVMIAAVVAAIIVMMIFAGKIGNFIERHPSIKVLALSFLLMIGVMLVADGFGQHVNKGYIYFAMAFSFLVELINMRAKTRHKKI